MSQDISSLRSELLKTQQQLSQLHETCLTREPLLPGSLYTLRRKCGKPNCRCNRGELHQSTVLSYRGQGRSRNISPSPEHLKWTGWRNTTHRRETAIMCPCGCRSAASSRYDFTVSTAFTAIP